MVLLEEFGEPRRCSRECSPRAPSERSERNNGTRRSQKAAKIYCGKVSFDTFVEVGPALYFVFLNPVAVFVVPTVSVGARYCF